MCQYLHVESRRFGCSSSGGNDFDCNIANRIKLGSTQMPDFIIVMWEHENTNEFSQKYHIKETEESYLVTKICEATFASHKSVKQHITARHGGPGTWS